ncbi:upstream activation factor subunit spp27-like isoform X1 [Xenia sp. Carnegie-2017]|uniref:upstream activation factor subunit spp27-like isoform X1 n=1 Tax=Xenia sp. Carnegie-2017 TaxID=2897299 RepID=UPI001F04B1F4|nr:upstream activation factor subunit spp27-like isoform X1 [Xenia sp. Carnegie-2017]
MATNIDDTELKEDIAEIIRNGDLAVLTSKKIRLLLEKKYNTNLSSRKKHIDDIVMQLVDEQSDDDVGTDPVVSSDSSSMTEKKILPKKSSENSSQSGQSVVEESVNNEEKSRNKVKANHVKSENEESESEDSVSDIEPPKPKKQKRLAAKAVKKEKTTKTVKTEKVEGAKKKTGFSMPMVLSAELAELMGETHMARPEVVKKMWQIIRERNLFDPSDKRFTLCDDQLLKIIGKKRFNTFAMMKFLKKHLKDPSLM